MQGRCDSLAPHFPRRQGHEEDEIRNPWSERRVPADSRGGEDAQDATRHGVAVSVVGSLWILEEGRRELDRGWLR